MTWRPQSIAMVELLTGGGVSLQLLNVQICCAVHHQLWWLVGCSCTNLWTFDITLKFVQHLFQLTESPVCGVQCHVQYSVMPAQWLARSLEWLAPLTWGVPVACNTEGQNVALAIIACQVRWLRAKYMQLLSCHIIQHASIYTLAIIDRVLLSMTAWVGRQQTPMSGLAWVRIYQERKHDWAASLNVCCNTCDFCWN